MRRFGAWYGKEVRGQRGLLIAFAVAIPALTFLAGIVFPALFAATTRQADSRTDLFFLAVAAALVVVAVCGDLFSREGEEGTIALVRRLPGALVPVFAAKVAFLASLVGAVLLWQAGWLVLAWRAFGRIAPERSAFDVLWRSLSMGPFEGERLEGAWLWPVAVLGAWGLLGSTWSLRGGVALGAGVVLLGLLLSPYLATDGWQVHAAYRAGLEPIVPGVLTVLALAAAAWSFLGGARYVRSAWSAVVRGALVLLVGAGAAHAWAVVDRAELFDLRPGRPGIYLLAYAEPPVLGSGARHLFLTAVRDVPALPAGLWVDGRAWLRQAFVMDLSTGRVRALGDVGSSVSAPAGRDPFLALDPVETVCVSHRSGDRVGAVTWTDARTAQPRRSLAEGVTTEETLAWTRAELRRRARCRDAEGRSVWLRTVRLPAAGDPYDDREVHVEWQDGERVEGRPLGLRVHTVTPMYGGWRGWQAGSYFLLAAKRGEPFPLDEVTRPNAKGRWWDAKGFASEPWWQPIWAGEDVLLCGADSGPRGDPCLGWRGVSMSTGAPRDLSNPPCQVVTDAGPDTLLVTRRVEGRLVVSVWNPVTGEDRPCAWEPGNASPLASIWGSGWGTGDGRRLIVFRRVVEHERRNAGTEDVALFDPTPTEGPTIRLLRTSGGSSAPIGLREDGALLVRPQDDSGVEWWGPEPDRVERIPFRFD